MFLAFRPKGQGCGVSMPLVHVRILHGAKLLGEPARPYVSEGYHCPARLSSITVQALEPFKDVKLANAPVDVYKDETEKARTAQSHRHPLRRHRW